MIQKEQRIAIAKEIVDGSLSSREAAEKYGISKSLAAKYATDFRRENGLPVRTSPFTSYPFFALASLIFDLISSSIN